MSSKVHNIVTALKKVTIKRCNDVPERHSHSFSDRRHKVATLKNDGDSTVSQRHEWAAVCGKEKLKHFHFEKLVNFVEFNNVFIYFSMLYYDRLD